MSDFAERLRRLPEDARTCLAFFSRLPIRDPAHGFDLRGAAGAWPLAGLAIGLVGAVVLAAARTVAMPPFIAAILAIAALVAVTGAMHEDGLGDTADGFGGSAEREARLEIMRDSRIGTFGLLAILLAMLMRLSGLAAISLDAAVGALGLVLVAVLSRSMALWHWRATPAARGDGLAYSAGQPDWGAYVVGAATGVAAGFVLLLAFGFAALLAILLAAAGVAFLGRLSARLIGGHTGDTIGAAQQVAEALLFAGLSAGVAVHL